MEKMILIVDDSRTARMFIQQCFEIAGFSGYTFLEASNGKEALDIIRENSPISMLITDINMPEMDGITFIRKLREQKLYEDLPILIISSTQNPARELELTKLGVKSVFSKPLNLPIVTRTLQEIKLSIGQ